MKRYKDIDIPVTFDLITSWIADRDESNRIIEEALTTAGPLVIRKLLASGESLRSLARRSGLSPTYLSRVRTGGVVVSSGAFVKLVGMMDGN